MKKLLLLILLFIFTACTCKIKYVGYNPSNNKYVEYSDIENIWGEFDHRTGDTVLVNGEKVVIICHTD